MYLLKYITLVSLSMVVHIANPSTGETSTRRLSVLGQLGLDEETVKHSGTIENKKN